MVVAAENKEWEKTWIIPVLLAIGCQVLAVVTTYAFSVNQSQNPQAPKIILDFVFWYFTSSNWLISHVIYKAEGDPKKANLHYIITF